MATKTLLTVEQFAAMPEEDGRFELVEGALIELPNTTPRHALVRGNAEYYLGNAADAARSGVVIAEVDCRTGPSSVRRPSLSFLLKERWNTMDWDRIPIDSAPEIAIEVILPPDKAGAIQQKAREYLAAGSREVWLLYLEIEAIVVWTAQGGWMLDGADLLETPLVPGFAVRVQDLYSLEC